MASRYCSISAEVLSSVWPNAAKLDFSAVNSLIHNQKELARHDLPFLVLCLCDRPWGN